MADERVLIGTLGTSLSATTTGDLYVVNLPPNIEDLIPPAGTSFLVAIDSEGIRVTVKQVNMEFGFALLTVLGISDSGFRIAALGAPVAHDSGAEVFAHPGGGWYGATEFWSVDGEPTGMQPDFAPSDEAKPLWSPFLRQPYRDWQTDTEGQEAYERTMRLVDGVNRIAALVAEANGGG